MFRGSREDTIHRGFKSALAGLVLTAVGLGSIALSAPTAMAAGDGKSAALANELKALSATNALAVPEPPATTTVRKSKTKSVAKKRSKKSAGKSAAGEKVKLSGKSKSKKVAAKSAKKRKGTKVASASAFVPGGSIKKSLVKKGGKLKGNVSWNAPSGCVPGSLKGVLYQVSQKFGPVVVNSTARGHRHNRRVGGARKSWHLRCMATDFRVRGNTKGLYAFLRRHPSVGGVHRYPSGFFHIDLGPKRTW